MEVSHLEDYVSLSVKMAIKQWDKSARPREKALTYGMRALSDAELLALILRCGNKELDAVGLASCILKQVQGVNSLVKMSVKELTGLKGVGLAKACEISAAMELVRRVNYNDVLKSEVLKTPETIVEWLKHYIGNADQEYFVIIFLNNRNCVLGYSEVFKGSGKEVSFSAKNIFEEAIKYSAEKIIIAHNHPSQDVNPSLADNNATKKIFEASKLMDIPMVDHIIVSYDDYYSYREKGVIL